MRIELKGDGPTNDQKLRGLDFLTSTATLEGRQRSVTHVEQPSNWVPTGLLALPCKVLDKPLGVNINKKLGIEARSQFRSLRKPGNHG